MKRFIILISSFFALATMSSQNIDSLFYTNHDTIGLAKSIAKEEAEWRWTDTLHDANFTKIDNYAMNLTKNYKNIPALAKALTKPYEKEEEKVRSIFMWIVHNLAYDEIELERNRKNNRKYIVNISSRDSQSEITKKYQKYYYKYATKVMRKKRGICEGYSTLFYELCKASDIQCEMVNGYADYDTAIVNNYKKRNLCPTMHSWNKVEINGEWLYIDVTWANRNIYNGKRYESEYYNPLYYLVTEDRLYETHIENKPRTQRRNELVGNY